MITDFFFQLWLNLGLWVLSLFGEYTGLPTAVEDAVSGVGDFFSSTGSFLGALNHWFPVTAFISVVAVSLTIELGIAFIRGVRVIKQLLPFQ